MAIAGGTAGSVLSAIGWLFGSGRLAYLTHQATALYLRFYPYKRQVQPMTGFSGLVRARFGLAGHTLSLIHISEPTRPY